MGVRERPVRAGSTRVAVPAESVPVHAATSGDVRRWVADGWGLQWWIHHTTRTSKGVQASVVLGPFLLLPPFSGRQYDGLLSVCARVDPREGGQDGQLVQVGGQGVLRY